MFINKFRNYFLLYLSLLLLFGIFFLYTKHTVPNDSTISEWIINYQGGFGKRGLIGEICFQIAQFFNIKLRFIIFLFQSIIYSVYIIMIFQYLKNIKINYLILFVIFSPIFILYPVAEIEVLARKELFIFIGFLLFLNFSTFFNKLASTNGPFHTPLLINYLFFLFRLVIINLSVFLFFLVFKPLAD